MPNPWIICHRPRPAATLRLYCFPYAGAGAAVYRLWPNTLPPEIEIRVVQPPGRESRIREKPHTDMPALVDALYGAVEGELDPPYAFFGHSFGSWVAFELARRLRAAGVPGPTHLFISGRRAPPLPQRLPTLHRLPDDEFVNELEVLYGGIPAEIRRHEDLMQLLLPCLRADLAVAETYVYEPGPKLACPLSVFGGIDDASTTREELDAWRNETTGSFNIDIFPGGHFFLDAGRARLLALVRQRLSWTDQPSAR